MEIISIKVLGLCRVGIYQFSVIWIHYSDFNKSTELKNVNFHMCNGKNSVKMAHFGRFAKHVFAIAQGFAILQMLGYFLFFVPIWMLYNEDDEYAMQSKICNFYTQIHPLGFANLPKFAIFTA